MRDRDWDERLKLRLEIVVCMVKELDVLEL